MTKIARPVAVASSPIHQHDCEDCMFLGSIDGKDMYHCAADGCYIKRTGSRPEQNGALSMDFAPFPPGTEYALAMEIHNRAGKNFQPKVYKTL